MKPFKEFTRFRGFESFYACVDKEGNWFDSSIMFTTAVHWCCMAAGKDNLSQIEEMEWMDDNSEFSVIHSSMLEKMYYAQLIK